MSKTLQSKVLEWVMAGNGVGMSAKAMAGAATGNIGGNSHPYDPSDFNRCLMLINKIPEIKFKFSEIAKLSDTWALLIDRWDELEKSFIDEVGFDWCSGRSAPITYKLIKSIID